MLSQPVPVDYTRTYSGSNGRLDFLKSDIPIIMGASDGCLANLSCGGIKPVVAVMTIGTSGAVRMASSKPLPNDKAMTFNYILDEHTFICGGPINNGGIALQWWLNHSDIKQELDATDYEGFFAEIRIVQAGSNGLIFLPYLTGERAPIWDSESCGENGIVTNGTFTINEETNEITLNGNLLIQNPGDWMSPVKHTFKVVKAFPGKVESKGIWFGVDYNTEKDEWFAFHYIL